jgi:hypothetical protein
MEFLFQLIRQPTKTFAVAATIEDFIKVGLARNGFDAQIIGHTRQSTLSLYPHLIALAQIDERAGVARL